jgi:hypothetical protein
MTGKYFPKEISGINIISEIQEILNEKNMYADMKAAYDFNNELF